MDNVCIGFWVAGGAARAQGASKGGLRCGAHKMCSRYMGMYYARNAILVHSSRARRATRAAVTARCHAASRLARPRTWMAHGNARARCRRTGSGPPTWRISATYITAFAPTSGKSRACRQLQHTSGCLDDACCAHSLPLQRSAAPSSPTDEFSLLAILSLNSCLLHLPLCSVAISRLAAPSGRNTGAEIGACLAT